MESTLMVIGINPHSAPVEVRERFWITEARQLDALTKLGATEGIAEAMVVSTAAHTDFILWAGDPGAASAGVLNFLTHEYGLQLSEWKHFYRKVDTAALAHIFLAVAGLGALVREKENGEQFRQALERARTAGALGRVLDSVIQQSQVLARDLRNEATRAGLQAAETMAGREAKVFYAKLLQERVIPTITALRARLDDICVKELESFYAGLTSLSAQERELVEAFATRLTQRIAGTVTHELREPCERFEQERLTTAVQRLFSLETLQRTAMHSRT